MATDIQDPTLPIRVYFDTSSLQRLQDTFPELRTGVKLAYIRALKRATNSAGVEVARRFRESYPKVPVRTIRDRYVETKTIAKGDDISRYFGVVKITGKPIALQNFGAKERKGVGITWYAQNNALQTIEGAFYQTAFKRDSMKVFLKRETDAKRLPIRRLYGPSMYAVFSKKEPLFDVMEHLNERVAVEIRNNLGYYLDRAVANSLKATLKGD
jgi:hypothetical protein